MSANTNSNIEDCCQRVNPCEALCMLEAAELNLATGKELTSYKIGEETFVYKKPSLTEVRALIEIYQGRCRRASGQTARRRGGGRFMYGTQTRRSSGTCGSGC